MHIPIEKGNKMSGLDFDIVRPETWIVASEKQISWEGVQLYNAGGGPLSEKDVVDLFEALFAFLEHTGDHISYEQQQKSVQTVLNRMKSTNSKEGIEKQKKDKLKKRREKHYKVVDEAYKRGMAKLENQQKAWGEAVEQAEKDFNARGITKLSDETPGYLERINQIYHEIIDSQNMPKRRPIT